MAKYPGLPQCKAGKELFIYSLRKYLTNQTRLFVILTNFADYYIHRHRQTKLFTKIESKLDSVTCSSKPHKKNYLKMRILTGKKDSASVCSYESSECTEVRLRDLLRSVLNIR